MYDQKEKKMFSDLSIQVLRGNWGCVILVYSAVIPFQSGISVGLLVMAQRAFVKRRYPTNRCCRQEYRIEVEVEIEVRHGRRDK